MSKPAIHVSEAEAASDFPSLLARVRAGAEVVIERNAEAVALHRDLLRLRRDDPVFARQQHHALDGAVIGPEAFVLRFFGQRDDDRLLLVNLGPDLYLRSIPDPLVAPPERQLWQVRWSSEDPAYGGAGTPPIDTDEGWHVPGHAAIAMAPGRAEDPVGAHP